jgi:hypothetical protein
MEGSAADGKVAPVCASSLLGGSSISSGRGLRAARESSDNPAGVHVRASPSRALAAIANGLNAHRVPTAQDGRRWYAATVRYALKRAQ